MQFVGVDGEGIDGKYCLLQDSQGGKLFRIGGLPTLDVFTWFLSRLDALSSLLPVFVGYVTTYDVNMILKDVDDKTLAKIFATDDKQFVRWKDYEILYIPRKVFKLRRVGQVSRIRSFVLYDVFTFFGTSFVNACGSFLGDVPAAIVRGKEQRRNFRKRDLQRIEKYNQLEVIWLVKLCERLQSIFESQDIHLRKWHGPGAVAEYVLGKRGMNIHEDFPTYRYSEVPIGLFEAWDCAYYGGRFENMGIGSFRNVWTYDINSAYPFALSQLSTLTFGTKWKRVNRPRDTQYGQQSVYLVEWKLSKEVPFGPFPWRDAQGRIFYPTNGLGWYWQPEVSAALRMFGNDIKLWECWYQPEGTASKFATEIPRLYELRNSLKRKGEAGEYAIKIALNSIYGKLAQRVGNSPFRCIPWAGWITSRSRSMLLDASLDREKSVLAFATDSVFTTRKMSLHCNSNLGAWKAEHADTLLILMNGFYRLDDETRKRKSATRGLPPVKDQKKAEEDITWEEIISSLNRRQTFTYPFTQFVTHSMAIHFPNKFGKDRLKFVETEKTIRPFEGTRRLFEQHKLRDWERQHALSQPVSFPTNELSYPSSLPYASVTIEEEDET